MHCMVSLTQFSRRNNEPDYLGFRKNMVNNQFYLIDIYIKINLHIKISGFLVARLFSDDHNDDASRSVIHKFLAQLINKGPALINRTTTRTFPADIRLKKLKSQ